MTMKWLDYFKATRKPSASIAKERLQIIIAHERTKTRGTSSEPPYLKALQEELISVIAKYVHIDANQVKVGFERSGESTVLEVNIPLPDPVEEREGVTEVS